MCTRAIRPGLVGPLPVRTPRDRACGREAVLRVPFPHARCLSLPGREVRVGGREVQRPRPAQRPAGGGEGDAGQVLSARRPRPPRTARLRRRHGFRRSVSPLPHVFVQPGVHPRPPCCQSDIEVVCSLISLVISVPLTPRPPIFGEKPRSRAQTSSGRCSRGRLGASTAATQARTRRLLGRGHPASAESSSPTSPQVPCSEAGMWGVKNSQPLTTVTPPPLAAAGRVLSARAARWEVGRAGRRPLCPGCPTAVCVCRAEGGRSHQGLGPLTEQDQTSSFLFPVPENVPTGIGGVSGGARGHRRVCPHVVPAAARRARA